MSEVLIIEAKVTVDEDINEKRRSVCKKFDLTKSFTLICKQFNVMEKNSFEKRISVQTKNTNFLRK